MNKYQEMVGKRCRITTTNEEVIVLALMHTPHLRHQYWFHVDGAEMPRGTEVRADLVELA